MNQHDLESLLFELDDEDFANLTEEHIAILASNNGLSDDELNELLGFTRKKTLIKKIMDRDPQADEDELKALSKSALKKMLKAKQEEADEDTRGFFAKAVDKFKGAKDVGIVGDAPGTLLGGKEVLDIKERDAAKKAARDQVEKELKIIEYQPLTDVFDKLDKAGFPNMGSSGEFKSEAQEFQKVYDDIVAAHKAEQVDTKTANVIISVLRATVIYFQNYRINDSNFYKAFGKKRKKQEGYLNSLDLIFEEEQKIGAEEGAVAANFEAAYGMKLPLGLLATGAACMTLGFAAESAFVQDLLGGMKDMKKIQRGGGVLKSSVTKAVNVGGVQPDEGIIKVTRRMVPGAEKFGLPGGPSIGDVFGGGKNATVLKIIKASMNNAQGPAAMDKAISMNADPARLFTSSGADGMFSGTSKGIDIFGLDPSEFTQNVTETIEESLPTEEMLVEDDTTRNKILNGLMKWAGPALKGLGLGFLAAGVGSGFLRWKGKGGKEGEGMIRGSRMSILKVMVDGFKDVGKEGGEDDPPLPPPGEDEQIVIDLFANRMTITVKDPETGEEEEVDLDLSGYVPNLPALVELGITTPDAIIDLLSEAHEGEFIFKNRQGEPKNYPEDEGTFGASFKNFDDYPTLLKWVNALLKVKHPEFGPITKEMLDGAIGDGQFTLNDKRAGGEDDPPVDPPPVDPPPGQDRPRLGLIKLDDDGLKLYRTRGNLGDKRYDDAKAQFQAAQDQALTGRDTSPSSEDIEDDHVRLRRTPGAADMTIDQMIGRRGVRGKDLKPNVEVEPYFTLDKGAHSDLYLKKKGGAKSKSMRGMDGKVGLPGLGKDQKSRSEKMLKAIFKKVVSGKKKLTRGQANQVVRDYMGRGRGGANFDKETRSKVVDVLVGYGLVREGIEEKPVLTESKNSIESTVDERWMALAGLGEGK